jgi:hypothetical protein
MLSRVPSWVGLAADRRRSRRLRTWLRVDYCPLVVCPSGMKVGGPQRAVARNLSADGLLLTEVGYLPIGTVIHLFLRLPDVPGNPVRCYGRVVRVQADEGVGYGVRLIRLRSEDAARLDRYVSSLRSAQERAS